MRPGWHWVSNAQPPVSCYSKQHRFMCKVWHGHIYILRGYITWKCNCNIMLYHCVYALQKMPLLRILPLLDMKIPISHNHANTFYNHLFKILVILVSVMCYFTVNGVGIELLALWLRPKLDFWLHPRSSLWSLFVFPFSIFFSVFTSQLFVLSEEIPI